MQFLVCVECGENRITAPAEASPQTRFTCRDCTARLAIAAHVETARQWHPSLNFLFGPKRYQEAGEA